MNRINYNVVMVEVRNVYGQLKVYPANNTARTFAEIAGTNTLTHRVLQQIENLGYVIESVTATDWRKAA